MVWRPIALITGLIIAFYWRLTLSRQYEFMETFDLANQVLPWLQVQVDALRHGQVALWTPFEWLGQPLMGQMQPGVFSPFTWLLALTPLHDGQLQFHWVNLWFVGIHLCAALCMFALLRDLEVSEAGCVTGATLFATIGFFGNTDWPQVLASAVWSPVIFLYVFRTLRGQSTIASASLAGVFTAMAWYSGYFAVAYYLTLATAATLAIGLWNAEGSAAARVKAWVAWAAVFVCVAAPQLLAASEYGRLAVRWTGAGPLRWNQKVAITEHFSFAMKGSDIVHMIIPGADLHSEPFTGAIALALAAIALTGGSRTLERKALVWLALGALAVSLAGGFFLYGAMYALLPLLEKVREPVTAIFLLQFAAAALAGMGVDRLLSRASEAAAGRIISVAGLFGAGLFTVVTIVGFYPFVPNMTFGAHDPRTYHVALIVLLFAGAGLAWRLGVMGARTAACVFCLLALAEQSQMAGYYWPHISEANRRTLLPPLRNTRDLADFLRAREPARVEVKRDDGPMFTFGDWYSLPAVEALSASMLADTADLGWATDRLAQLYGVRYTIAKAPTRPGQREVFRGASGLAIFENPGALPRTWTVHEFSQATSRDHERALTQIGPFDPALHAVTVDAIPQPEKCASADTVTRTEFRFNSVTVDVNMACRGLLVVSDIWYPGWRGHVDGESAPIFRVDSTLRAVLVGKGAHRVEMHYRPTWLFGGFALAAGALVFTALASRVRAG